jgi:hypothetical protein
MSSGEHVGQTTGLGRIDEALDDQLRAGYRFPTGLFESRFPSRSIPPRSCPEKYHENMPSRSPSFSGRIDTSRTARR